MPGPLDVVIPVHPKDILMLSYAIHSLQTNCKDLGTIYIVSQEEPDLDLSTNLMWISESTYPFTYDDVAQIIQAPPRVGWYYQQLLKFYAPQAIPKLSQDFLVWDADCVLCQPTEFCTSDGKILFDIGFQNEKPYFDHAERVLGSKDFIRFGPEDSTISGITDHMVFSQAILTDILSRISQRAGGTPAWRALLEAVDPECYFMSGMSEFEIYFHFVMAHYRSQVYIRPLLRGIYKTFKDIEGENITIASLHSWQRHGFF